MEPARQRTIAIGLAAIALVLAGVAAIVVIVRSGSSNRAAPAPAVVVEDRDVRYDTLRALDHLDAFVAAGNGITGVRLKDGELATKLGVQAGDVIVALSGRPTGDPGAARLAVMMIAQGGDPLATVYVELSRAGQPVLARWHVTDRPAKTVWTQVTPPRLAGPVPPALSDPSDPLNDAITQIDDTHVEIKRSAIDQLHADPAGLMKQARIVPSMKDGKPNGLKLYGIRPSSAVHKLGFQNGDTLQAVNGFDLTGADKALEAYTKLHNAAAFQVEIERRGQPMTIHITIK